MTTQARIDQWNKQFEAVNHGPATQLPWRVVAKYGTMGDCFAVENEAGALVCDNECYYPVAVDEKDMAYIVHAANAYPRLVALLKSYAEVGSVPLFAAVLDGSDARALLAELGESDK